MTQTPPDAPRRSSPPIGLVVLGLLLLFVVVGVFVWFRWSADSETAADDARAAMVQPAELPAPEAGAVPANPGATSTGNAYNPQDERGLSPAEGGQPAQ